MGPISLFDKSFLQSLSVNESVWFDNFYLVNIAPIFYIETLADLSKQMKSGRTAEQIVGEIAAKTPETGGVPNVHHMELYLSSLMGNTITMDGRPILAGGRPVKHEGKRGFNFDISPEAKAFGRWQEGEYLQVERDFAKSWRAQLQSMTFEGSAIYAKKLGIDIQQCKNINDAYTAASKIINTTGKPYELLEFVLTSLAVPQEYHQTIVKRYQLTGFKPFGVFAPYAAFIAKIEIFFHISVSRGFIGSNRPSNIIDVSYLYYLPFCQIFISNDKLHRSIAPLFMKDNQKFIWGQDLKEDLKNINKYYMLFPDEVKEMGISSFASSPPPDGEFLTSKLWDFMNPKWRDNDKNRTEPSDEANEKLLKHLKGFTKAETLPPEEVDFDINDIEGLSLQRNIHKKKGSWYQVPKNLKNG